MIEQLLEFLQDIIVKSNFFIEIEGKYNAIQDFIAQYNRHHSHSINTNTEGVIVLQADANKWGKELRLYVPVAPPDALMEFFTRNTVYRSEYPFRLNNNDTIEELLLKAGYRIGINRGALT